MPNRTANFAEISKFMGICPSVSARGFYVTQEIGARESLGNSSHLYPLIELRWLNFKLRALEEKTSKAIGYQQAAIPCERVIGKFVPDHQNDTQDSGKLRQLIQQQKELIFNSYLEKTILSTLKECQTNTNSSFSEDDVLKKAVEEYQTAMYKEELNQFETICLINRQYFLEQKMEVEKKDLVSGMMTINTSIRPELEFIKKRLEQSDLVGFKLQGMSSLLFELTELTDFSQENIRTQLNKFFDEEGDEGIDSRVTDPSLSSVGNNIKIRSFNQYLNNPEYTTCLEHMSQVQTEIDDVIKRKETSKNITEPVETQDKSLLALRILVKAYQDAIHHIEKDEKKMYENRSSEALKKRSSALEALKISLNGTDALTENTRHIAKELVMEIKHNEPTWIELSFIDKLLDIITLGAHALYRHSMFKEAAKAPDLPKEIDQEGFHTEKK